MLIVAGILLILTFGTVYNIISAYEISDDIRDVDTLFNENKTKE